MNMTAWARVKCWTVIAALAAPCGAANVWKIAATGEIPPGYTNPFIQFERVTMNADGRVAFYGRIDGNPFHTEAMFTTRAYPGAAVELFAEAGAPMLPGQPVSYWNPPGYPITDIAGRIGGLSRYGNGRSAITVGTPGALLALAMEEEYAPDIPGFLRIRQGSLLHPVMNYAGRMAFVGEVNSAGALWTADPGEAVEVHLWRGAPVPGLHGAELSSVGLPVLNGSGQIAVPIQLKAGVGGITVDNRSLLMWGPPENLQMIAREGDAVPGLFNPRVLDDFHSGSIRVNNSGKIAFRAKLRNAASLDWAIVAGLPEDLKSIANEGQKLPGMITGEVVGSDSSNWSFSEPLVNGTGDVCFKAIIKRGSVQNFGSGLWVGHDFPGLQLVLRSGDTVALPSGTYQVESIGFTGLLMNGRGDIIFLCGLTGEGVDSSNNQVILHWNKETGISQLLREGDSLPVGPGDVRVATTFEYFGSDFYSDGSGGEDGLAASFADYGVFVLTVGFADGSEGIFAVRVPDVGCPADGDGDRDVDSTDLNILLGGFGCAIGACVGDLDSDGDTDTTDLNILLSVFGSVCP